MKRTILTAGVLASFVAATATAQTPYFVVQSGGAYVPLTGGTPATFLDTDDGATNVDIGFTFNFYGVDYTHANIGINGALSFATTCSSILDCSLLSLETCGVSGTCEASTITYMPDPLPSLTTPNQVVAPFWDDLFLNTTSPAATISTQTLGTAPHRRFVVEWANIRTLSGNVSHASWQIWLFEDSGAVRVHYGPYNANAAEDSDWGGVMGIEDATGMFATLPPLPCATTTCDYTTLIALQNQQIDYYPTPNGAELIGGGSASTGGEPGTNIDITVEANNIGPVATSTGFVADVYFSADTNISTAADSLLGRLSFAALDANTSTTASMTAQVPMGVTPGFYTIAALVDATDTVVEDVELNNLVYLTTSFLVGSDLSVDIDTIPTSGPNEVIPVVVRLLNNGSAQPVVPYSVYFSLDQSLDVSDILIGTATVAVPAAPITTVTLTATVPGNLIPDDYYLIAVVDPNNIVNEANETNNSAVSPGRTEIIGPDLAVQNLATGSPFAFIGDPYQISATIRNDGGATAAGFIYSFYLSENQLISALTDIPLGDFGPIDLAPGAAITVTETGIVPPTTAAGPYYVGVIVDSTSQVLETLETNNIDRTRDTIEVRDPAPDFTVATINLPTRGAAGETLFVERELLNAGNASGTVTYEVYLSEDNMIDPNEDVLLAQDNRSLAAHTDDRDVDRAPIPAGTAGGHYYIGYLLDPGGLVDELFEDNNAIPSQSTFLIVENELAIQTDSLAIATVTVPYHVLLGASGGSGSYTWSITAGALPRGLALDASGNLSGTPVQEGLYDLTISVTDGTLSTSKDFSLLVASPTMPLEIVTRSVLPAFVDRNYEYPLTAFGGVPPYRWSSSNPLPGGLTLREDGMIIGVPTTPAADTLNFRVEDLTGAFDERPIVVRVITSNDALRFSSSGLPEGRVNEQYDHELSVALGTGSSPFSYQLVEGELPPGLLMEGPRIHGIPTRVGVFGFTARVSDDRGDLDINHFLITITEKDGVGIVTTALPDGLIDTAYVDESGSAVQIRAVSVASPGTLTYRIVAGELPPGLTFAEDGFFSGTPTSGGTFSFTVLAEDDLLQRDIRALGIYVAVPEAEPELPVDDGCSCNTNEERAGFLSLFLLFGLVLLRRRLGLAVLFLACSSSVASAQVPYFTESEVQPYTERTGGTPITFSSNDDGDANIALPFPFRFFSTDFNEVRVGSNGYVALGSTNDGSSLGNQALPSANIPNDLIALWWTDLITDGASTHLEGTAPSRIFIIQYELVSAWGGGSTGSPKFQLWLHEGPAARFEIHYGPITGMSDPSGWSSTSGFEDGSGSTGFDFLGCADVCTGNDYPVDMVYRAMQDAGEEVAAGDLTIPSMVYPGVGFSVESTIKSLHQNPLGPLYYQLFLVPSGSVTFDTLIYTSPSLTLSPYQQLVDTATLAIPLSTTPGRYRIGLVVDAGDQIAEPDESNNTLLSDTEFRIAQRQPDFIVPQVTPLTTSAAPGDSVDVVVYLRNGGNQDASADWTLYLSRNDVISVDDLVLHNGSTLSLPLLTTATITETVQLPSSLAPGDYYVGAVIDADNLVDEISEVNNIGAATVPIGVSDSAVSITTTALPGAYVGVDYQVFLVASGGTGSYAWQVASGAVPQGMALLTTGEIRGTPTTVENASFTVRVESGGQSNEKALTLDVQEQVLGLTIVTREVLPGTVGDTYPPSAAGTPKEQQQHLLSVGNAGPVSYALDSTPPPGIQLDPDGYLHGVPTSRGVFYLDITADDGTGTATRTITLTVGETSRLTLVAAALPEATLGEPYLYRLSAVGRVNNATVTFTLIAGEDTLPIGLNLNTDGTIAGVPQAVGVSDFTVEVAEGNDPNDPRDSARFRLSVIANPGFSITPSTLPEATLGEEYEATLEARQGEAPFTWRLIGPQLPRGLSYQVIGNAREQLVISGTPELADLVTLLVTVTDSKGRYAEQPISIRVLEKVVPKPPPTDDGCSCSNSRPRAGTPAAGLLLLFLAFLRRNRRF